MEKIKEVFTGKGREERREERELRREEREGYTGAGAAGLGTTSAGYTGTGASSDYAAATGKEYTGGVAGGPAFGSTATGYTEGQEVVTEVPVVQQTTTTTAAVPVAVETQAVGTTGEVTCNQEYFTKTEDRPIVKERVDLIKEHRPVEKEFVVETRATGVEREAGVGEVEHLGTTERVVAVTPPSDPCA